MKRKNEIAISINSYPFYKSYGREGFSMVTLTGEYIRSRHEFHRTSYSFIYGREMLNYGFDNSVYGAEITKIFGKRKYFFEIGGGISYNFDLVLHPKIGGRVNIGEHFLVKVSYIRYMRFNDGGSSLFITDHFASISFGYRFNLFKKK